MEAKDEPQQQTRRQPQRESGHRTSRRGEDGLGTLFVRRPTALEFSCEHPPEWPGDAMMPDGRREVAGNDTRVFVSWNEVSGGAPAPSREVIIGQSAEERKNLLGVVGLLSSPEDVVHP